MTMKKHVMSLLLATSLAATASVAAMADDAANKALDNQDAMGDAENPTSGPGVQGHPGTRTGPAAKPAEGAEQGAGDGSAGAGSATTQPSQDSSGVQGFPDTRTGPATHKSGDDASGGASTGMSGEGATDDNSAADNN